MATKLIKGPAPHTDEWYAVRRNPEDPKFGASDAATLCGLSSYSTQLELYHEFVSPDLVPRKETTADMRRGQIYERAIQHDWAQQNGRSIVVDLPMLFHPSAPLFATLDAIEYSCPSSPSVVFFNSLPDEFLAGLRRPLESKFSMSPKIAEQLGEENSDWIPSDWYLQVQQQMDVVERDEGFVAVLLFGKLKSYHVERRQSVVDAIHERADEMRNRILHRLPPPVDCEHSTTKALVNKLAMGIEGGEMEAPQEIQMLLEQHAATSAERLRMEKIEDLQKTRIKAFMVTNGVDALTLPDSKPITLKIVDVAEQVRAAYSFPRLNIPKRKI